LIGISVVKINLGAATRPIYFGSSLASFRKFSDVVLSAGDGFGDATDQPSDVGDSGSPYYSETAIARWGNVVYREHHSGETVTIEIVADHISGISSVEMSLDDGPWATISQPSASSYLGCASYQATIDTSALADGLHEVRAIVTPNIGRPRVLQGDLDFTVGTTEGTALSGMYSMWFSKLSSAPIEVYVDSSGGSDITGDGTNENPYQTIPHAVYNGLASGTLYGDVSNTTVVLKPGDYAWGQWSSQPSSVTTSTGWLKVKSSDTDNRATFNLPSTSANGTYPTINLAFEDIDFDMTTTASLTRSSSHYLLRGNNGGRLWFNRCNFYSDMQTTSGYFSNGFLSGTFHEYSSGFDLYDSMMTGSLGVQCSIQNMILQSYRFRGLFNCTLSGLNDANDVGEGGNVTDDPDPHPDIYQIYIAGGTVENVIIRGLTATENNYAQGLYFSGATSLFKDISIEDVNMDCTYGGQFTVFKAVQIREACQHFIMRDSQIRGANFLAMPGSHPGAESANFASTNMVLDNVLHTEGTADSNSGDSYLLYPDGPGAGGAWLGNYAYAGSPGFPWTSNETPSATQSPTNITYQNME